MITQQSRIAMSDFISKDDKYSAYKSTFPITKALSKKDDSDDGEIKKYYTFNQTGNIMISSTVKDEKDVSKNVKKAFNEVILFFAAWTAALASKEKTLYDADAITSIIEKSGFFVRVHQEERTFDYTSAQGTLNTAIIGSVLSSFSAMGGALKIAQSVVGSMGEQLKIETSKGKSTKKIGHLLFICENLMGMPIISVSLLNTTADESKTVTKSNCHSTVQESLSMTYRQDTFLFVDPTYINKFTSEFESNPDFDALIKKLASYIPDDKENR